MLEGAVGRNELRSRRSVAREDLEVAHALAAVVDRSVEALAEPVVGVFDGHVVHANHVVHDGAGHALDVLGLVEHADRHGLALAVGELPLVADREREVRVRRNGIREVRLELRRVRSAAGVNTPLGRSSWVR
jgi:hypothetical protein